MDRILTQLGYVGIEASRLDDWERFATRVLGLGARRDPASGGLLLRMDQNDRRLIVVEGPRDDVAFVGWQTADQAGLDAYARKLDGLGIRFQRAQPEELALRGVEAMLWFEDPLGVRHEAYHGPLMGPERFVSPSIAGSFVTGDGGLGHVVFGSARHKESLDFASKVLEGALTDIIRQPVAPDFTLEVTFFHVNQRHHSMAFAAASGPKLMHHFMVEVDRVDEVGRARDRALKEGFEVQQDIGQHPNDRMISIYVETPSGFLVEFGAGGVMVHDDDWRVVTYPVFSEWGHRPAAALA